MKLITVTMRWVTEPLSLRSRDPILTLCAFLFSATAALAQGTILQGGPWAPGHAPMYTGQGSGQAVVQDSGPAGGGATGYGLSEQLLVARGTGTPPYVAQGTGPFGTNWCDYDAPITNPTGYHFLCMSANAQGGGLIAYGAGGAASQLPFQFNLNGTLYQLPFSAGGVIGPATTVIGDVAIWNNSVGTLLKDVAALQIFGTEPANCVFAGPTSGGSAFPTCRTLVAADISSVAVPWANITGTPTTLAGYGITNARTQLTGNTTFYVNGNSTTPEPCNGQTCQPGSDSNNGLSIGAPFLTLQHAINVVQSTYDLASFQVIIQLSDATAGSPAAANYGGVTCLGPFVGAGTQVGATIQGNVSTQTNVHVTSPNGSFGITAGDYCVLFIQDFQFDDAGSSLGAVQAIEYAVVDSQGITYNSFNSAANVVAAHKLGDVNFKNSVNTIIGGGAACFMLATHSGVIQNNNATIAIPSAVAFTTFACGAQGGHFRNITSSMFTGSGVAGTTGIRAALSTGATLGTNPASPQSVNSVFPGNANATLASFSSDDNNDQTTQTGQTFFQGANETGTITDGISQSDNGTIAIQRIVTGLNSSWSGIVVDSQNNNSTASQVSRGILVTLTVPPSNSTAQATMSGLNTAVEYAGTGGITNTNGDSFTVGNIGTGTVTNTRGFLTSLLNTGGGTNTLTDGVLVGTPVGATTGLTSVWTNINGIEIQNQNPSGAGTNTLTNPPVGLLIDSQTASGAFAINQVGSGIVQFATASVNMTSLANSATTSAVCYNTGTGRLTYDGTIGTCNTSDERLKNIGPRIDSALERLLQINGFYYTYKEPAKYGGGEQIGVGAQTVEKVFPELVSTDADGIKSVAYDKLAAPIIEAMRELKADNDNLHACQNSWKCRIFGMGP